ncbi:hypothetical protein KQX54_006532 [Cotesia glomerata]|uniref:Uncharacterized protein n=1 Tax=Cotesia glomerata TaxID=32391 RepID=A0AAV7I7S7_COTGL|nr:hypothetical protein KQX54_006532 [Cotesia glomerata]
MTIITRVSPARVPPEEDSRFFRAFQSWPLSFISTEKDSCSVLLPLIRLLLLIISHTAIPGNREKHDLHLQKRITVPGTEKETEILFLFLPQEALDRSYLFSHPGRRRRMRFIDGMPEAAVQQDDQRQQIKVTSFASSTEDDRDRWIRWQAYAVIGNQGKPDCIGPLVRQFLTDTLYRATKPEMILCLSERRIQMKIEIPDKRRKALA